VLQLSGFYIDAEFGGSVKGDTPTPNHGIWREEGPVLKLIVEIYQSHKIN
jgi:hypothetical protein